MNGTGTRRSYGMEPAALSPFRDVKPSDRAMVKGYREEVMDGFVKARPKYNPLNADRPQSSPLVDLKDPIQVHLLTETALADSREWEILSQEEVDGLKKQCLSLTERIEQTQANLAIQSKYRDAAISMAKLYSPSQGGKRRSLLGNRASSSSEAEREAEAERTACERRCEELASELFALEKRIMEPQRQLLQHTAGILQLTHKGASRRQMTTANMQPTNGIPGSPESLYTYSNGRESVDLASGADDFLDERGLYLPIGLEQQMRQMGGQQQPMTNRIEIPQKSPIRQETKELRDETTRLQTECEQLQASNDSLGQELDMLQRESSEREQMVADAEQQLGQLNGRLREVVVQLDTEKHSDYQGPPPVGDSTTGAGLADQLQYLDDTLQVIQDEQAQSQSQSQLANAGQAQSEELFRQIEERMAAVNGQIERMLAAGGGGDGDLGPVPATSSTGSEAGAEAGAEAGIDAQLGWLQGALPALELEMTRAGDVSGAWQTERQSADRVNTVLSGLWEIMQSGLIEQQRKRAERQALRVQRGMAADDDGDDDVSGDESPMGVDAPYSLEAFSAEVQWLYEQTTKLREHKSVLKRQVKQQRELNNKSDAEKDEELRSKSVELEEARQMAEAAQDELARALADLSEMQQELLERDENVTSAAAASEGAQEKLAERDSRVAALEARGTELQKALAAAQEDVAGLATQLQEAAGAEQAARKAEQAAKESAEQAQEAARLASQQAAQQAAQQAQEAQQAQQAQQARLDQQTQQSQKAVQQAEETAQQLQQQLQEAEQAREQAEREAKGKDEELERLNDMVVELKTEATIAKAELDGAYGSRRQRAADVAALAKSSADVALQEQLAGLKEELAGTLKEYEDLTRDTIAAEREKVDLEGQLDEALAARAALEAEARKLREKLDVEVTALKEQLDAERLKVGGGGVGGTRAGASMLSDQFRATMKEERKKFQEELRTEQAQRRKVEEELRMLKRAAKPAKSPLSPR